MVTAIEKEDKLCSDFHFVILIEWRRITELEANAIAELLFNLKSIIICSIMIVSCLAGTEQKSTQYEELLIV